MNRKLSTILTLLAAALLGGCLSPMPLAESDEKPDAAKALYLISVAIRNDYRERWQPRVLHVVLTKENGEQVTLRMGERGDRGAVTAPDGTPTYLVRFNAEGRSTTLAGMNALASAFPIHGNFFVPLYAPVPSFGPGVYYLGSVKARVRERKDNEFPAGPLLPLMDQNFSGASSGTFDIEITDAFAGDVELFRKSFPALKDVQIIKAILPPWERAKAQKAWEK